MKKILLIAIFVSTLFGSIVDQNFITIDNASVTINNDADFYSYIDKLNDANLTNSYKEATRAINRIDNPYEYKTDTVTYEEAFASLRYFYPYLGDKNSSNFIDANIAKLKSKKKLVIAQLLAANRNRLTDANDASLIIEYFQITRELSILQLNKINMTKTVDEIINKIWQDEYKFEYDVANLVNTTQSLRTDTNVTQNNVIRAILLNDLVVADSRSAFINMIKNLQKIKKTNTWGDANSSINLCPNDKLNLAVVNSNDALAGTYEQSLNIAKQTLENAEINRLIIDLIIQYYQQPIWQIEWDKFVNSFMVARGEILDYTLFIFDNNNVQVSDILDFARVVIIVLIIQLIISWLLRNKLRHVTSPLLLFIINVVFVLYLAYDFATQTLNLSMTNFTIFASTFSLALGFGMQSLIQNFVAGLIIIGEKTIKKGDFIMLSDGNSGFVTDINYRTTTLLTEDNIIITVPNSKIFLDTIQNKTKLDPKIRVKTFFFVDQNADFVAIESVLKEACKNIEGFVDFPTPELVISSFTQSGVRIEFRIFVKNSSYDDVKKITKTLYGSLQGLVAAKINY